MQQRSVTREKAVNRRDFIGGSDARIIMGDYLPAFLTLRGAAFARLELDALSRSVFEAGACLRRTPGCPPFVNSTPASSSARRSASTVRSFNSSPRSNLATVSLATFAARQGL